MRFMLQEFGEEGHLVHSGMLRSAQYLFDRLQGLVEVRGPAELCLNSTLSPSQWPQNAYPCWAPPTLWLACSCSFGAGPSDAGMSSMQGWCHRNQQGLL